MAELIPFYDGDLRIQTLVQRLQDVVDQSRDSGISVATMIGALELTKHALLKELLE